MKRYQKNIQAAVWSIGLIVLALTHHWWPGIMILVGISMLAGALTRGEEQPALPAEPAADSRPPEPTAPPAPFSPEIDPQAAQAPAYNLNWVPNRCISCGGPLNVSGLKALDSETVVCPFCGTKISRAS